MYQQYDARLTKSNSEGVETTGNKNRNLIIGDLSPPSLPGLVLRVDETSRSRPIA
jgi:hypothetical protein